MPRFFPTVLELKGLMEKQKKSDAELVKLREIVKAGLLEAAPTSCEVDIPTDRDPAVENNVAEELRSMGYVVTFSSGHNCKNMMHIKWTD